MSSYQLIYDTIRQLDDLGASYLEPNYLAHVQPDQVDDVMELAREYDTDMEGAAHLYFAALEHYETELAEQEAANQAYDDHLAARANVELERLAKRLDRPLAEEEAEGLRQRFKEAEQNDEVLDWDTTLEQLHAEGVGAGREPTEKPGTVEWRADKMERVLAEKSAATDAPAESPEPPAPASSADEREDRLMAAYEKHQPAAAEDYDKPYEPPMREDAHGE